MKVGRQTASIPAMRPPMRVAQAMLTAIVLWHAYLAFWGYRLAGLGAPGAWDDLLTGHAAAPEQYRMGAVLAAHGLHRMLPVSLPLATAALAGVCGCFAGWTLLRVLERSETYREAGTTAQWLGATMLALLTLWSLGWLQFQLAPETLPAALGLALLLWQWQSPGTATRHTAWRVVGVLAVTLLLATVRADVACVMNAGVFLFALRRRACRLSLDRTLALLVSGACALLSAAVQLWLMRVVYRNATYGDVKLWQLWPNLHHATRWPPFLLFLLPFAWLALQLRRTNIQDDAGFATCFAAALYLMLWLTVGKIDEVRIFVPFALALTPLAAQTGMRRAAAR